jgi:O-antigen/teichoic acid export membrane protein
MRFRSLAINQAVTGVSQGVITLILALCGAGVWSLVVGTVAASGVRLIATWAQARPRFVFSTRISLLRPYFTMSSHLVGQRLLGFWVEQADTLIVGRLLGAQTLGYFSVAKTIAHMPLDKISEIVNQVSLPAFAALQDDRTAWLNALEKVLRLAATAAFPLFFGMAAVSPAAMHLLLGNRWLDTTAPFALFCLILPLRSINAFMNAVVIALGRTYVSFTNLMIWGLLLPPAVLAGSHFGIIGVAAAWALIFPCVFLIGSARIAKHLDLRIGTLLRPLRAPALCAAAMMVAVYSIGATLPQLPSIAILAVQIAAGAVIYPALLRLFARSAFEDSVAMAVRLLSRR